MKGEFQTRGFNSNWLIRYDYIQLSVLSNYVSYKNELEQAKNQHQNTIIYFAFIISNNRL